jgi:hypothetical protein
VHPLLRSLRGGVRRSRAGSIKLIASKIGLLLTLFPPKYCRSCPSVPEKGVDIAGYPGKVPANTRLVIPTGVAMAFFELPPSSPTVNRTVQLIRCNLMWLNSKNAYRFLSLPSKRLPHHHNLIDASHKRLRYKPPLPTANGNSSSTFSDAPTAEQQPYPCSTRHGVVTLFDADASQRNPPHRQLPGSRLLSRLPAGRNTSIYLPLPLLL